MLFLQLIVVVTQVALVLMLLSFLEFIHRIYSKKSQCLFIKNFSLKLTSSKRNLHSHVVNPFVRSSTYLLNMYIWNFTKIFIALDSLFIVLSASSPADLTSHKSITSITSSIIRFLRRTTNMPSVACKVSVVWCRKKHLKKFT
jgi:hypothetical protein